jgi:hypothetical protein
MDIYVAGKTNDWQRVRQTQEFCERLGHRITYDWTKTVERVGPDACTTGQVTEDFRRECAEEDRRGTREADLLIMLCYPGLCGTLIECGMALGLNTPVLVIGDPERNSVFFALPQVTMTDEECLRDLGTMASILDDIASRNIDPELGVDRSF